MPMPCSAAVIMHDGTERDGPAAAVQLILYLLYTFLSSKTGCVFLQKKALEQVHDSA